MTTQEIANRFYQLSKEGKWNQIQDELFSKDARSIEPQHGSGDAIVIGLDKIKEKGKRWEDSVVSVHSGYCNEPQVAGNYFTCTMGMDVTMKNEGRMKMDEVALYEVRDGKIVMEQFFY